ncbi:MAG: hypothetical protein HUJ29_02020 [Gammaproteobacteria bacterium]|nr:hypothetical protein [Gammaproteobacteria bacterium]
MHTIQLYIDENLNANQIDELRTTLMGVPHVVDVEFSVRDSHDMLVEYEEHRGMPMDILHSLRSVGLHPDVVSA